MDRTLAQVNAVLDTLILRVNQLDGVGLADPTESTKTQLQNQINGLKETVQQVTLTLDAHLNEMQAQLDALTTLLTSHLGG